jgi:glycine cleavage system regulatory protein
MGTFKVPSNAPKHKEKNPRPYVVDLEGQYVWDLTEFVNKIWTKANVGVEEVTDLAKRMEAKYISANDFTDKLAQYRIAFESAGREGEFQKHLMDNFNTDNEAHIVREFFKSAKPIIDEINKLYKGLK